MKKILSVIGMIIAILVGVFLIYICEESVRLNNDSEALPLIVTDKTKYCVSCLEPGEEADVTYYSIGYKVNIKYGISDKSHDDIKFVKVNGKEFMLFNRFRLWAWVE